MVVEICKNASKQSQMLHGDDGAGIFTYNDVVLEVNVDK